ncbi:MAG: 8-oxo-dGTP diphosphatase [Erysipelotrichaceae bacterium]
MNTSLCYIEKENQYLMLHRNKKAADLNQGKWIGVGGKFENNETPEACMIREVWEETNLHVLSYEYKGIVTFCYDEMIEYMHLFKVTKFEGEVSSSDEGTLKWIDKQAVYDLNLWEGDRYFLPLLEEKRAFFSMKLVYNKDKLIEVVLDGKRIKNE